jgi:hypothetical protein
MIGANDSLSGFEEGLSELGITTTRSKKGKKKKKKAAVEGEEPSENSSKLSGVKRKVRKIKVFAL